MGHGTRSIGAVARESGLTVSALRFYDAAGVLRPAHVDPATGYRWYSADQVGEARLIAVLRRVGMPIPALCEVLAIKHDLAAATRLLDQHQQRLEDGLADACRHLATARRLLQREDVKMTTMTVLGADLTAGFDAVRFAMSDDPDLPALCGVLFDYDGSTLRLVTSDRYRLAVAAVPARNQHGPAARVIAPMSLISTCTLERDAEIPIALDRQILRIGEAEAAGIDAVFPDYQRVLQSAPARQISVIARDLTARLVAGPTRSMTQQPDDRPHDISAVLLTDAGTVDVIDHDHPDAVGFNREFLLEGIRAHTSDQLVLALDGPITPLAIRSADRPEDVNLLMPTRLA